MSIATMRGDGGETGLAGGIRVSKASLRVETYGTVDELNSVLGFARAICTDGEVRQVLKQIQQDLFQVGSALATPPNSRKGRPPIHAEMVAALTAHIHRIESMDGVLVDWSIPGEDSEAAALDMARAVCRRAERCVVRFLESEPGAETETGHVRQILAYLNRLSDLLWIFGRLIEKQHGKSSALRNANHSGPRWSRAW